jgi:hypothetical protein
MRSGKADAAVTNPVGAIGARGVVTVAGELAGAAFGSAAGPIGAIVGMVVGGLAATLARDALDRDAARARAHDEELDRETGVFGGDIGIPPGTTMRSEPITKSDEPWPELSDLDDVAPASVRGL